MPAWLIPYWIADVLVTVGLVLTGVGLAGIAFLWLRTRLGGERWLGHPGAGEWVAPLDGDPPE